MSASLHQRLGRADPAVAATLWLAAAAWALLVLGFAAGRAVLVTHDAVIEGGQPLLLGVLAFVVGWAMVVGAMMFPTATPVVGAYARLARTRSRPWRAVAVFLAAYLAVWVGFGVAALVGDTGLHAVVHAWPWLEEHPSVITAGLLVFAGGCQFLPVTRRCLAACRDPGGLLARSGFPEAAAWTAGIRHGVSCLGASWAPMLLMFAVGMHSLGWMAAHRRARRREDAPERLASGPAGRRGDACRRGGRRVALTNCRPPRHRPRHPQTPGCARTAHHLSHGDSCGRHARPRRP